MQENIIISALIGLIGACNNNPKTANTDRVVMKALAFPLLNPKADADEIQEIKNEIYAEKNAVAPGCALCAMPCGNTSDYDMNRIYGADEKIRDLKLRLLTELQKLAVFMYPQETETLPADYVEFLYRALSYISYDLESDSLLPLLEEVQSMLR